MSKEMPTGILVPKKEESLKHEKLQSSELGWNNSMAKFLKHGDIIDGTVLIDGTEFEEAFDKAYSLIKEFAESEGSPYDWEELGKGKLTRILIGDLQYVIASEDKKNKAYIRADGLNNKSGGSYFTYNPRKIEIAGSHARKNSEILENIKEVLKFLMQETKNKK